MGRSYRSQHPAHPCFFWHYPSTLVGGSLYWLAIGR
uniref:Uncharacterized protein n=1 Tax=Arundo donax TaxID=35708 RepID=A0A0A9CN24_ARUDO